MDVVVISDTHNMYSNLKLPKADMLICCGDMLGSGSLGQLTMFNEWLIKQPFTYKIVIAGNHDWCFQNNKHSSRNILENKNIIYLQDESVTIDGINFYGSPQTPFFFDWAFNVQRGEAIKQYWDKIPNDTDVLITHGPPYGVLDVVPRNNEHVGCEELLLAVERVNPKYHLFGHIHNGYGRYQSEHTTFINASICTEEYRPTNKYMEFSI